jgi:hypothetical protein
MTMPLMLRAPRGEHSAPEDHVLGSGPGRVDEELDGHPHPALIWTEAGHGWGVTDAHAKRIRHVSPHRACWTSHPPTTNVQ